MFFDYETSFIEIRFPLMKGTTGEPVAEDNFLKVKETLTRIGAPAYGKAPNEEVKILWQSCHILHKRQKYFLVHFKELFLLDGKESRTQLTEDDLARRNAIALLLAQWGLVEIVDPGRTQTPAPAPVNTIKIIPYRMKGDWELRAKYEIGKPARPRGTDA